VKLVRGSAAEQPTTIEILSVGDVSRARSFYRDLLGVGCVHEDDLPLRFQPRSSDICGTSLRTATWRGQPRLHIDITPRLEQALDVAWERGGLIVETPRRIDGRWRAMIMDSEGNLVALYSASNRA
jgi:predicted enzyme related to lactoylglutathione lyase